MQSLRQSLRTQDHQRTQNPQLFHRAFTNTSTCYRAGQFSLAQDAKNFRAERIVPTPLPRNLRATTSTGIYDRPQVGLSVKQIIGLIDDQGRVFAINRTVYAGTGRFDTDKRFRPENVEHLCPRCVRSRIGGRPAICCCLLSNALAVATFGVCNTLAVKKHARVRALQHDQRISIARRKTRARERSRAIQPSLM